MKILNEKFDDIYKAQKFWDECVFDMLDISFFLVDNGLINEGSEFCQLFSDQKRMDILTKYSFNFEKVKKFLGVPFVYLDRKTDIENLQNAKRNKINNVDKDKLQNLYNDVMTVLYDEIGKAK